MRAHTRPRLSRRVADKDPTSAVALNIAATQVEVIEAMWQRAEEGFNTLTEAAENATGLLEVRDNLERADEARAAMLA